MRKEHKEHLAGLTDQQERMDYMMRVMLHELTDIRSSLTVMVTVVLIGFVLVGIGIVAGLA